MGIGRAYVGAFRGLPRTVWIASAVAFLNRAGTMVLPFLGLWLGDERGFSKIAIGVLLASWGAGSIAGTWLGGWLSDRWSAKEVLARSLVLTAAGFVLLPQLHSPVALAAGLFLVAATGDAFRPAMMAYVAVASPAGMATKGVALLRLFVNAGMSTGPAVGGLLAMIDYHWIFRVDAATCLLAAAGAAWWIPPLPRVERTVESSPGAGSPWRDRPAVVLLALSFTYALVFFQILGAWPLYLSRAVGLTEARIGLLFALNAGVIMVAEMAIVAWVSPLRQVQVAGWGVLLACLGFGATGLVVGFGSAALTVVIWTVGEMFSLPIISGLFMARAPAGRAGQWMGAFGMNWAIAMLVAPILGTAIWDTFGAAALWSAAAVLGPLLWVLFRRLDQSWEDTGADRDGPPGSTPLFDREVSQFDG